MITPAVMLENIKLASMEEDKARFLAA